MGKKHIFNSIVSMSMTCCMIIGCAAAGIASDIHTAGAARKAKPAVKKLNLLVGEKKTIKIKKKAKKAVYGFKSSNKKVALVSKKGVVTAKKQGTAKITLSEKKKGAAKAKKIGKVSVIVSPKTTVTNNPAQTTAPAGHTPASNPTPTAPPAQPTTGPVTTPTPVATPITYPDSHEAPEGFDAKQDGVPYGTVEKIQYFSSVTGKNRNANIILPPNYSEEKKYPVLYLFHGIGGNENEWLDGKPNEIVSNLIADGLATEMIMVIPNIRAGANDSYPSNPFSLEHYAMFDNFINDLRECLMPYMEDHYPIALGRENTAICGLSMGGRESLYIGFNMLPSIGYIAALSPGYGVFAYEANGVAEKGLFTEETFTIPEDYRNNTFIMIVNGISEGGENALGGTCSRVLEKNGVNHWFYTTPGAHDFVTWKNGLYNFAKCIFK
ncbi:MAG: hypothetical protein HFH14_02490 [Lachnospiraceae bacterium]|nr:hypothetical protein [Lachnospiraceae bacterium]